MFGAVGCIDRMKAQSCTVIGPLTSDASQTFAGDWITSVGT